MNGIVDWLISYSVKASLLCLATLLLLAALRGMSASVRSGILVAGVVGALVLPLTVGILPPISLSKIFPEPA